MRHILEPLSGRRRGAMKISPEEFKKIADARRRLLIATGVEEKLHLLLDNYADLERSLLDLALKHLIYSAPAWSEFQDDILTVNRRLANVLSAARSYLDQVDHDLSEMFGKNSAIGKAVRESRAREYDGRLGYRVLEALRDYQQHRGFPVHHVSVGMRRDPVDTQVFVAHGVTPSISVPALRRDGGIKPAILKELEGLGKLIPVMPLVREYVEGLAVVHSAVRTETASHVQEWDTVVRTAMARGRKRFGKSGLGFAAVALNAAGGREEELQMFDDFMNRRTLLERRSRHITFLAKHYVSGRSAATDA